MTSHDFTQAEIDERAFAIFLTEGIHYFLEQDPPLREGSMIEYCSRLWNRWRQMSDNEKRPFWDRAIDELHRLRRYRRADIYRSVMRDDMYEDETRRRDPNIDNDNRRRRMLH